MSAPHTRIAVFDLDGTLIDSDEALLAPYLALGVAREDIQFGHLLEVECARQGVAVEDYLAAYDEQAALPFPGVVELIQQLERWAVCSNKHPRGGRAELARIGWEPEVSMFCDAFAGTKELGPVLEALGVGAHDIVFVGDTAQDRACAAAVGATFALAGWNPRVEPAPGDVVLGEPGELLGLLA